MLTEYTNQRAFDYITIIKGSSISHRDKRGGCSGGGGKRQFGYFPKEPTSKKPQNQILQLSWHIFPTTTKVRLNILYCGGKTDKSAWFFNFFKTISAQVAGQSASRVASRTVYAWCTPKHTYYVQRSKEADETCAKSRKERTRVASTIDNNVPVRELDK